MSITYKNNEQIVIELKKLMLEKKISQREIADRMQIKPQGLTKVLSKKNFGFEDAEKILSAIGYDLIVDFKPSINTTSHSSEELLSQFNSISKTNAMFPAPSASSKPTAQNPIAEQEHAVSTKTE